MTVVEIVIWSESLFEEANFLPEDFYVAVPEGLDVHGRRQLLLLPDNAIMICSGKHGHHSVGVGLGCA